MRLESKARKMKGLFAILGEKIYIRDSRCVMVENKLQMRLTLDAIGLWHKPSGYVKYSVDVS